MNLKPVYLLLGLWHAGHAAAIGLGEIQVHSFLGQPLDATIAILDIPPDTASDCFKLAAGTDSIAPPLHARLTLEQAAGRPMLHLRTTQPIADPIAQFVLVYDCETRLQRDYVVLLDPPALPPSVAESAEPRPADSPVAVEQSAAAPAAVATRPVAQRPQALRRSAVASARTTAPVPRQTVAAPAQPTTPATPRLILSGKHRAAPALEKPLALRLDSQLTPPKPVRPSPLSPTELSDENTALSRKIAHLEAQLAALQQRNVALDARRAAAAVPPAPPQSPQWPLYLLAIGLLGGGAMAFWLRQRARPAPAAADPLSWTSQEAMPALPSAQPTPQPAPQRIAELPPALRDAGTEVKEDILDQAEVFMAHGHGELAIHLLQEHLRDTPAESPVPWLLLLDLLHRAGDTAAYAAASVECRRYFNIDLGQHPAAQSTDTSQGLEAYPHVLEQLVQRWRAADVTVFLDDLINDDRGGTRMGFAPDAYRDILLLRDIARQQGLSQAA